MKGALANKKRALIVGSGIGGPVAAMALQRAGIEAVVYEAYDAPADYAGLFLNIASNGLDVLHSLDIDVPARADGFPAPRMVIWSGTGKRLGEVANGLRLPDGTVSVIVKRGQLQRVLREEAESRDIRVEYGKRLLSYEITGNGGVIALFEDGTEAEGDLLVGADGIHSRVRQLMDPGAPRPSYTGLISLGGYAARGPRIPPTPRTQHFVFGKKAFFGYLVRETGEIWWFANVARSDEPSRKELSRVSSAEWKRRLLDLFSGDLGLIGDIIESTRGEIGAYPVHDIPTAPTWHRGHAVLIGDAVHATSPNSGQGASLAVEDAIVLARSLRDLRDTERAFAAYERSRRERVEKVVAYSRRIGQSKAVSNPVARWIRDQIMPFALKHFANTGSHAWLYTYHVDWDEKVAA
ncbi:MAG TPA: FAD-dependent monooxygenase [Rubrobacteraceae bacterium]|nr:FAD-dependent monooxygenase [Rubrobacteraceae bacterium]